MRNWKRIFGMLVICLSAGCGHIWNRSGTTDSDPRGVGDAVYRNADDVWDCFRGLVRAAQVADSAPISIGVGEFLDRTQTFTGFVGGEVPNSVSDSVRSAVAALGPSIVAMRGGSTRSDLYLDGSVQAFDRAIFAEEIRTQGGLGWSTGGIPGNLTDNITRASTKGQITLSLLVYDRVGRTYAVNSPDFSADISDDRSSDEWGASIALISLGERKSIAVRKGRFQVLRALMQLAIVDRLSIALGVVPAKCFGTDGANVAVQLKVRSEFVKRSEKGKIRAIQKNLIYHGNLIAITGVLDDETLNALKRANIPNTNLNANELEDVYMKLALAIPPMSAEQWLAIRQTYLKRQFGAYATCNIAVTVPSSVLTIENMESPLDGEKSIGVRPGTSNIAAPCSRIALSVPNYFPLAKTVVELTTHKHEAVTIQVPRDTAMVNISGEGMVSIDETFVGRAPLALRVAPGKRTFKLGNSVRTVNLKMNQVRNLDERLRG